MSKIPLIIEKGKNGFLGRVVYDDNLIVVEASTIAKLESSISQLLKKYNRVDPEIAKFQHKYDLSSLFEKFDYLKISTVAEIAGLNASLLRQYVIGNKHASYNQAKKIETTIHKIGKELLNVEIYSDTDSKFQSS